MYIYTSFIITQYPFIPFIWGTSTIDNELSMCNIFFYHFDLNCVVIEQTTKKCQNIPEHEINSYMIYNYNTKSTMGIFYTRDINFASLFSFRHSANLFNQVYPDIFSKRLCTK